MAKQYTQPGFLRSSDCHEFSDDGTANLKQAAVLIPLLRENEEWHVLFIRRAERLGDRHSGQVAFPGGKREPADPSIRHTALREAEEEIGLAGQHVEVLGELSTYRTISHFRIHPFVSLIPWPLDLTAEMSEVARIFTIPLRWLQDDNNYFLKVPDIRISDVPANINRPPAVYYKKYKGELLWGATARMTLSLLHALDEGRISID